MLKTFVRTRQMVKNLTDNPDFPNANPPLAQITATVDALEAKVVETLASRQAARANTAEQNVIIEDTLDQEVDQIVAHIESFSGGGDEKKIIGAGVSVRSASAPAREVTAR